MGHKVYISFKTEDARFKEEIQSWEHLDYVDKSLNEPIDSENDDYVLRTIREEYLHDSTVTVFLIGENSSEDLGAWEQRFIKGELQASLYNREGNTKSGVLGVVLPSMMSTVYKGSLKCSQCGETHRTVMINDSTVIKEFSFNFYIPKVGCAWAESERFCVLVPWESFKDDPNTWIDKAYDKRSEAIAAKTKVRP
ncbi:TIR domain-containing protein [Corynebacterium ammoniagenes]|uniref:Thoeris protein ThsB TIR-like domain-containing protein n=1 Tax=Corynebacterium ammoniagenes DSM 20306 TaxID=649754 RepID=A0ABN0ABY3_CORAM|nr:TIR domain-containing protein [Corynebacterium ammoniagenes]APT82190.1 molecular chaperone Tir [Corynebacterium ammoniagenes DSM 20306]AQS73288.1 molecular chaperone Tir [Corynebacterium ammoniagenes]EFG80240.1 hypothetical protein HMPREF0281_02333 [Corynebacterium ammoniagenes DSM 20306]